MKSSVTNISSPRIAAIGMLAILTTCSALGYGNPAKIKYITTGKAFVADTVRKTPVDSVKVVRPPATAESDDATPLDEAMVMAYSARKTQNAHPQTGWGSFEKYIRDKAIVANGNAGTVELTITVDAKGTLNNIQVTKSLNEAANKTAIDLVKNGPAWVGAVNGQPEKVVIKVKFQ